MPFLDHMLDQLARHGMLDLTVHAKGDLHIDAHHTVEDIGITLGQAVAKALGDKKGLTRYGHAYVPLDEALSRVVIDLSGRPGLEFHVPFTRAMIGAFDVDLAHEFFQGFVNHALVTLHVDNLRGQNAHHQAETVFKAFARALADGRHARPACGGRRTLDERFALGVLARAHRMDIAVVDYGMGNLRSVAKALVHVAPDRVHRRERRPGRDPPRRARRASRTERDARLHARPRRKRSHGRGPRDGADATVPRDLPRAADAVRIERGGAHDSDLPPWQAPSSASATRR